MVIGAVFKIIKNKEVVKKSAAAHITPVIKNLNNSLEKETELDFFIY
jgi:hypothetical protein